MLASNMLGPDVTLELDLQPVPLILGDTGRIVQVRGPGSSFTQPLWLRVVLPLACGHAAWSTGWMRVALSGLGAVLTRRRRPGPRRHRTPCSCC